MNRWDQMLCSRWNQKLSSCAHSQHQKVFSSGSWVLSWDQIKVYPPPPTHAFYKPKKSFMPQTGAVRLPSAPLCSSEEFESLLTWKWLRHHLLLPVRWPPAVPQTLSHLLLGESVWRDDSWLGYQQQDAVWVYRSAPLRSARKLRRHLSVTNIFLTLLVFSCSFVKKPIGESLFSPTIKRNSSLTDANWAFRSFSPGLFVSHPDRRGCQAFVSSFVTWWQGSVQPLRLGVHRSL